MSKRSRRIELAVSVPPAPLPMMVWVPECSEVNDIAFNVPFTHNGSSTDISTGATRSPPLHDATSFMAELFFSAAFTFGISILRIPVLDYIL